MKIMSIHSLTGAVAMATVALVAGCDATDVVARVANESFAATVSALPEAPSWSEGDYAWELFSPKGDLFALSASFSRNNAAGKPADLDRPDAEFAFEAAPFIAAGLDAARLPARDGVKYELEDGSLMVHF